MELLSFLSKTDNITDFLLARRYGVKGGNMEEHISEEDVSEKIRKEIAKETTEETTKKSDASAAFTQGLEVLLERIEEQMTAMQKLKNQVEEILGVTPAVMAVCEPQSAYSCTVQKETTLMADYILDENGRIANIQFNLVKKM